MNDMKELIERLDANLTLLGVHAYTHQPVKHITNGERFETELLDEIINDTGIILDKIKDGTLNEKPCNVGDDVYIPWHYNGTRGIAHFEVTHIIMDCKESYVKTDFETDDEGFWDLCNGGKFYFDDFGKTIFLTIKEAEKALKEGADDGKV